MPTYEYNCQKCGIFEHFHSITTILTKCPNCDSEVQRLISRNNNIIFKGSGFHTTDYRSGDYQKKATGDSSSGSSTTPAKTEGKSTESKESVSPKNESKAS